MATLQATRSDTTQGNGCGLLLGIIAVVGFIATVGIAVSQISVNVSANSHANKHGSSSDAIRNCNTIEQVWTDPECKRMFLVKKLDNDQRGLQIIEPVKSASGQNYAVEVTSYIPKCGILCKIEQWFSNRGLIKVYPP